MAYADHVPGHDANAEWMRQYDNSSVSWVEGVVTAIDANDRQVTVMGKGLKNSTGLRSYFNERFANEAYRVMTMDQLRDLSTYTFTANKNSGFYGTKAAAGAGISAHLSALRVGDVVRVAYDDGWFTDSVVTVQVFGHNENFGKRGEGGAPGSR